MLARAAPVLAEEVLDGAELAGAERNAASMRAPTARAVVRVFFMEVPVSVSLTPYDVRLDSKTVPYDVR